MITLADIETTERTLDYIYELIRVRKNAEIEAVSRAEVQLQVDLGAARDSLQGSLTAHHRRIMLIKSKLEDAKKDL